MKSKRASHACIEIKDEFGTVTKISVAGGSSRSGVLSSALKSTEIYDIKTDTWCDGPDLLVPIASSALVPASPSSEFSAYIIAGRSWDGDELKAIYMSNVDAISKNLDHWINLGNISHVRAGHVALMIPSNLIKGCSTII